MRKAVSCMLLASALAAAPLLAQQRDVEVRNSYVYRGQGRYDWTVYIAADRATQDRIRCVEYTLHPTFPDPVRKICDPAGGFPLISNGWGEFTVLLKIEWRDGRATRQQYRLDLHTPSRPAPAKTAPKPLVLTPRGESVPGIIRAGNTSQQVGPGQWRWTVYIAADSETLDQVRCVEYMLHPTFPNPVREVCERGTRTDQAFPLSAQGWGTFDVGIKVQFRDGTSRFLKHTLRFR